MDYDYLDLYLDYSDMLQEARNENAKLRKLFTDFWTWADPPFALNSGTLEQFMEIVEQARELGLEADG